MKLRTLKTPCTVIALAIALSACGGGGTGSTVDSDKARGGIPGKPGGNTSTGSSGSSTTTTTTTTTDPTTSTTTGTGTSTSTTTGTSTGSTSTGTTTTTTAPSTTTATAPTVPASNLAVYTDGTARLNAMLASGLNVVVPPGIYMIYGELSLRDGQTISAADGTQVILKAANGYAGRIATLYNQRVTFHGLTFDGNYANRLSSEGSTGAALFSITGGDGVVFENNTFQYAPSFGIYEWKSTNLQIRGNAFYEVYHPIRMDGGNLANSGVVENNTFKNTAAFKSIQHIEAIYTNNLVIRGNTMEGAGLAEPSSHGYEGTWGNSIYIFNSTGHLVENNKVYKNYWSSLVSGMNATHGTVRGNVFTDSDHTAIAAWIEQTGAEYITVDSNQFDGGLFMGDTGGNHLTITNNVIHSRGVGMDVSFATTDALIQGNQVYSKAGSRSNNGVYLWDKTDPNTSIRLINNHFEGFNNGVAVNNDGGVGTVYGISLSGNTFNNDNVNVWVPSGIVLNQPLGQ